jgi:hypothetical protein
MRPGHARTLTKVLAAALFGAGGFLIASVLIGSVAADEPGKPRGRVTPEPVQTMTPQDRAERFKPGKPWDGIGQGGLGERDLEDFRDYPIFWLGPSFEGYNLQSVRHVKYSAPPGARGQDRLTFVYGDCVPVADAPRCAVPAQLHVQPVCSVLPEWVAEGAKAGGLQTVAGGAKLQRFADGHVVLWTGAVMLDITVGANPSLIDRALAELRGAGGNPSGRGESLPPPDFSSCQSQ